MDPILKQFTLPLLQWHHIHGRKDLPWQHPREPYRVWVSEIMLQQTQVKTVIPYFLRFMERFPTIQSLAQASEDEVLTLWSGLGYYSRGRNLHKTAVIISSDYRGEFPDDIHILTQLPGIGPSTAAAITSQAFHQPTAILDGNVKRVLSRYFLVSGTSGPTLKMLWNYAERCMSHTHTADYTQAIMDLGATCCTIKNPHCSECPLQETCLAKQKHLTSEYPTKKPKKTIPSQYQQFLLMYDEKQRIYLEKRPSPGVWGGLWCTPTVDMETCPTHYIQSKYPLEVLQIHPLMNIKHTFTHFRLYIQALSIPTQTKETSTFEQNGSWFSRSETIKIGLAKPMTDIIQEFYSGLNFK